MCSFKEREEDSEDFEIDSSDKRSNMHFVISLDSLDEGSGQKRLEEKSKKFSGK